MYNINDLIFYATCSYKYKFKLSSTKVLSSNADDKTIITTALRDTYIHYFQNIGIGIKLNSNNLTQFFSRKCVEYKKSSTGITALLIRDTRALIDAHAILIKLGNYLKENDELVAVKYPIERSIRSYTITDEIDLLILRRPEGQPVFLEAVYFDVSPEPEPAKHFGPMIRAAFARSALIRELAGIHTTVVSTQWHIISNKVSNIFLSQDDRYSYARLLTSIIKGIEAESFYPRPSYGVCDTCAFNAICSWKIK